MADLVSGQMMDASSQVETTTHLVVAYLESLILFQGLQKKTNTVIWWDIVNQCFFKVHILISLKLLKFIDKKRWGIKWLQGRGREKTMWQRTEMDFDRKQHDRFRMGVAEVRQGEHEGIERGRQSRRPATNIYSGWGTKRGPRIPLYLDTYKW